MSEEAVRNLRIVNTKGLHARAAAKFVRHAGAFVADIVVSKDGVEVPGDSIMGLMMLAAGPGSIIVVRAQGDDAEKALEAIETLVANGFDEN
jgi:phosphocarrier protein HPr